ncbi:type II secretion system protein GspM [Dongshaea marina]|uniref:type II secretion system protein GspM n=1 Tax=Dongshaea marina TaxID=2047966 RepID=UPI000D3E8D85|nr:type II secretion system protein M [Dongshaea marina]
MKEILERYSAPLMQQWNQLNSREKKLVSWAGVAIVICILYWGIWQPLNTSVVNSKNQLAGAEQTLQWIKEQGNKLASYRASNSIQPIPRGSLESAVDRSARNHQIQITRIQPQKDRVDVWIENVSFNQLLGWLSMLHQRGVTVRLLDLSKTSEPGYVKVRRLQLGLAL